MIVLLPFEIEKFLFPMHHKIDDVLQGDSSDLVYVVESQATALKESAKFINMYKSSSFILIREPIEGIVPNIKLDTHEALVDYVIGTRRVKITKSKRLKLINLKDTIFLDYVLYIIHTGLVKVPDTRGYKFYDLYKALVTSYYHFLEIYFVMRQYYEAEVIFSSIITFLSNVLKYRDNHSDFYQLIINRGEMQLKQNIKLAINHTIKHNNISELTYLDFYRRLKYSN